MSEPAVVICVTKEDCPVAPVPSQTAWCHVCAVELWVSNTMVRAMADHTERMLRPMCMACSDGLAAADKDAHYEILPEQERELAAAGILDDVKRFLKNKNRKR